MKKNYLCCWLLCVVQDVAESSLAYKGLSKKLFALFWSRRCSFFSVINTTEGRELSMDVSARELASTVNNSDMLNSPFNFSKPGCLGQPATHDFAPKLYLQKTHMPIPRKPNSVHSVHSAIGSRMNGIAFRSFRKRNMFQKNAITVYSEYSNPGESQKNALLMSLFSLTLCFLVRF